ncbi:hypothetical protein JCM8547_000363 [Rhodosporidiobolus lusitaniae]
MATTALAILALDLVSSTACVAFIAVVVPPHLSFPHATAPSPPIMLDRLPVELLDILELTLPPETAYSAYRERQDILLSYCCVSEAVCAVAQPLLWRVFRPKENLSWALKCGGDLVEHPKHLEFINHLEKLVLCRSQTGYRPALVFPNLVSLVLYNALLYNANAELNEEGVTTLCDFSSLYTQLDMLQIHEMDQHAFPFGISRFSVPTLFTIGIPSSSSLTPPVFANPRARDF